MNRDAAIRLLGRLHKAQNEFYAGGSGYFRRRRDLAAGTFQMQQRDVLVGDGDRLAALVDGIATTRGADHRWSTVGLYDVIGGQIAACWLLALDQRAFDKIWSA